MYVSIKILRDCLSVYQIATSLIISSVQVIMLELSMCEAVGDETQDLIAETWSVKDAKQIVSVPPVCSAVLEQFEPVSLS